MRRVRLVRESRDISASQIVLRGRWAVGRWTQSWLYVACCYWYWGCKSTSDDWWCWDWRPDDDVDGAASYLDYWWPPMKPCSAFQAGTNRRNGILHYDKINSCVRPIIRTIIDACRTVYYFHVNNCIITNSTNQLTLI